MGLVKDHRKSAISETHKERKDRKAVKKGVAKFFDALIKEAGPPLPSVRLEKFAIILERRRYKK